MIRSAQWALAALFLFLAACTGVTARTALLPSMRHNWSLLRDSAAREIISAPSPESGPSLAAADQAIAAGSPAQVAAVEWPVVDALILADIDRRTAAGDLGPDGADSQRETLRLFALQRARFAEVLR
jgi:hypothetical protein